MKIQNRGPIRQPASPKTDSTSRSGAFGKLLESELSLRAGEAVLPPEPNPSAANASEQEAWNSLERGLSLLDEAMDQLGQGRTPDPETLAEIEALRAELRQAGKSLSSTELDQANTILAVEAARMRSMDRG